jgi:hypothetical protein
MKAIKPPAGFEEIAAQYGMVPEALALRLLERFVRNPPVEIRAARRESPSRRSTRRHQS